MVILRLFWSLLGLYVKFGRGWDDQCVFFSLCKNHWCRFSSFTSVLALSSPLSSTLSEGTLLFKLHKMLYISHSQFEKLSNWTIYVYSKTTWYFFIKEISEPSDNVRINRNARRSLCGPNNILRVCNYVNKTLERFIDDTNSA